MQIHEQFLLLHRTFCFHNDIIKYTTWKFNSDGVQLIEIEEENLNNESMFFWYLFPYLFWERERELGQEDEIYTCKIVKLIFNLFFVIVKNDHLRKRKEKKRIKGCQCQIRNWKKFNLWFAHNSRINKESMKHHK